MTKLKERLQSLDVYDQMVCNCHQDSKLLQVRTNINGAVPVRYGTSMDDGEVPVQV